MAKRKTTTKRRSSKSIRSGQKSGSLVMDIGIALGSFLIANYATNMIKGAKSSQEAGLSIFIPQALGISSPFFAKGSYVKPLAIGSAFSLLLGMIATAPEERKAKIEKTNLIITGDEDDSDIVDLSDLDQDQQALLGQYILTGSNKDPLSGRGSDYVSTMSGDNTDPLG